MKRDRFNGRCEVFRSALSCAARYGILLANIVGFLGGAVQAAPVTLQFDAIIGPPRQGFLGPVPPSWNISLQQGDRISGSFTFEPFDAAPNTYKTTLVQPFDFSIHIASRALTTSQFGAEVLNNVTGADVDQPYDRISLGCSFSVAGVECTPSTVSSGDAIQWAYVIALYGDENVLDGADIPFDPLTWQQFVSDNTMAVSFKDPVLGWSYGFLARIETFQGVPEPSTFLQSVLASMFILLSRSVLPRNRDSLPPGE